MDAIAEKIIDGYKITVEYDMCPSNPRDDDNLGTIWFGDGVRYHGDGNTFNDANDFLYQHMDTKDYGLYERQADKTLSKIVSSWSKTEEVREWERQSAELVGRQFEKLERTHIFLPVYKYEHSGVAFNTGGFSCRWDSGQAGFIIVDKATVRKEYGWKRITAERRAKVEQYLEGEIKTYSAYANGDVYGWCVYPQIGLDDDGEPIYDDMAAESCWGYHDEKDCMAEGLNMAEYLKKKSEAA